MTTLAVINMPGAFVTYWTGTSVGQEQLRYNDGQPAYSDDPELQRGAEELCEAWKTAKRLKRGRGYSYQITCPSAEAVMCLEGYADMCIHVNDFGDSEDSTERTAAVRLQERCEKVLTDAGYERVSKGYGNYDWVKSDAS